MLIYPIMELDMAVDGVLPTASLTTAQISPVILGWDVRTLLCVPSHISYVYLTFPFTDSSSTPGHSS